jgi:hypothetical protein
MQLTEFRIPLYPSDSTGEFLEIGSGVDVVLELEAALTDMLLLRSILGEIGWKGAMHLANQGLPLEYVTVGKQFSISSVAVTGPSYLDTFLIGIATVLNADIVS